MKKYGRPLMAIIIAVLVLIPLGASIASVNGGSTIRVESSDSLAGVTTPFGASLSATGTIQTAVNNAISGSTILLLPKIYYDNVDVNKNINIIGSGTLFTIVDGQKQGSVFTIDSGVIATLSSMTIQNGQPVFDGSSALSGSGGGIL